MNEFSAWLNLKKELHLRESLPTFHEREIWWCSLGKNIGYEQDGKNDLFERPVIIIRKFNRGIGLVVPLTSSEKVGPYYYKIASEPNSVIILSQIRLVSSKRLRRCIGVVTRSEFYEIRKAIKNIFN